MGQFLDIKVLTNPMDFDIGFAAIVLEDKNFLLVVLGKDNSVILCNTYYTLNAARLAFNQYARSKGLRPRWFGGEITYTSKPEVELQINGNSLFAWNRLRNILKMNHEKQRKYYGTCGSLPADIQ